MSFNAGYEVFNSIPQIQASSSALSSSSGYGAKNCGRPARSLSKINLPPGKLGVAFKNKPAIITRISFDSPIFGMVNEGNVVKSLILDDGTVLAGLGSFKLVAALEDSINQVNRQVIIQDGDGSIPSISYSYSNVSNHSDVKDDNNTMLLGLSKSWSYGMEHYQQVAKGKEEIKSMAATSSPGKEKMATSTRRKCNTNYQAPLSKSGLDYRREKVARHRAIASTHSQGLLRSNFC